MKTTFQVAGVVAVGRPAILYGVKNHKNAELKGEAVTTSAVRAVTRGPDGLPLTVRTQNTLYYKENVA